MKKLSLLLTILLAAFLAISCVSQILPQERTIVGKITAVFYIVDSGEQRFTAVTVIAEDGQQYYLAVSEHNQDLKTGKTVEIAYKHEPRGILLAAVPTGKEKIVHKDGTVEYKSGPSNRIWWKEILSYRILEDAP